MDGGRGERFTFDSADEFAPVWAPDGARVLFSLMRQGAVDLYVKNVNGLGSPQHLEVDNLGLGRFAADWSRDGRFIMYIGGGRAIARSDLWMAPTDIASEGARASRFLVRRNARAVRAWRRMVRLHLERNREARSLHGPTPGSRSEAARLDERRGLGSMVERRHARSSTCRPIVD